MNNDSVTYSPRMRAGIDLVLMTDVFLLLLHGVTRISFPIVVFGGILLNLIQLSLWKFWVIPFFSITITDDAIIGRNSKMKSTTIDRTKLNVWKTESERPKGKKRGVLDLWSTDGKRIRIFRSLIGRGNIFAISQTLLGDAFEANKRKYRAN